ncbi:MAG: ABC transporter permease, partial [Chloroflexi bacterium]|nr:ABC transporter permease [Chloroflexota bacterium]
MRSLVQADTGNIIAIARREFVTRARTRTFVISTLVLIIVAVAVGLVPVVIGYLNRDSTRVAVYVGATDLHGDPIATLDALLNPPPSRDAGGAPATTAKAYTIVRSTDLEADRRRVLDGKLNALLDVERDAGGEAVFTVYTSEPDSGRTALISRQAATSIAVADRLGRIGLTPSDQASLFVPPQVTIRSPDLSKPAASSEANAQDLADTALIFALEMFLLLAIILYGTWVAQSVVEEKASRMMEIVLVAASPFQILAGKVLGVSAAALLQFVAVVGATLAALLAEGQVASIVLGESGGPSLPSGLTPTVLVAFSVFFVLGFVLYAVLFAAAGSLVSRQEDVNQIVQPLTLAGSAGFLIATYSSIGMFDPNAAWVVALSWVPFLSPYMMLSRLAAGTAGLLEVGIAVALLLATIVLVTWFAGR